MPATTFTCPDGINHPISTCLSVRGCRMPQRCATRPFLQLAGSDRPWGGVTPSAAGNGPRMMYLKATVDYAVNPMDRVWAAFGTSTHERLALSDYTFNVLAEEKLSDGQITGIADLLEEDENDPGNYILFDHKTWGSYKVAKSLGITTKSHDDPIIENGVPVLLKSGKNKGKPKTKKRTERIIDPNSIDLRNEELQLNRYRILFNSYRFNITKIFIQVVSRDGGTHIAKSRGIDKNLYIIPIRILPDQYVLDFYARLQHECDLAFTHKYAPKCDAHQSWDGRRCEGYCEVFKECQKMGD